MPLSTDVTLRRHQRPRFPDRCVVCSADEPEGSIGLRVPIFGWLKVLAGLFTAWTIAGTLAVVHWSGKVLEPFGWPGIVVVVVLFMLPVVFAECNRASVDD